MDIRIWLMSFIPSSYLLHPFLSGAKMSLNPGFFKYVSLLSPAVILNFFIV